MNKIPFNFLVILCFYVKPALTLFKHTHVTNHRVSASVLAVWLLPSADIGYVLKHGCIIHCTGNVCCYWFCFLCGMIQCCIYIYIYLFIYYIYNSYVVIFWWYVNSFYTLLCWYYLVATFMFYIHTHHIDLICWCLNSFITYLFYSCFYLYNWWWWC